MIKDLIFKKRKMPLWGWPLLIISGIFVYFIPSNLILTKTASLDSTLFWKITLEENKLKNNAYVLFNHELPEWINDDTSMFLKRIGCLPGQTITVSPENDFYCDNSYMGRALTEDSTGRSLPITDFRGQLAINEYFMIGDILKSWDSKYFGPVSRDSFISLATPLL